MFHFNTISHAVFYFKNENPTKQQKNFKRVQNCCKKYVKIFFGRKSSSKLILKTKWYHSCGCCDNLQNCEQLKKRVTDISKKS